MLLNFDKFYFSLAALSDTIGAFKFLGQQQEHFCITDNSMKGSN